MALGLLFLKYLSEAFKAQYEKLQEEEYADPEDPEEYLAENVFWVPEIARWSTLRDKAKLREIELPDGRKGDIGNLLDAAMEEIEKANPAQLKGVLPKEFGRLALNSTMLGELIDLFSDIEFGGHDKTKDLLGRAYEYFLSGFLGRLCRTGRDRGPQTAWLMARKMAVRRYSYGLRGMASGWNTSNRANRNRTPMLA